MNRVDHLVQLRRTMGTMPEDRPPFVTGFYRGVEGIVLDMLDAPVNPYKAMYCMATSTWGTGLWGPKEQDRQTDGRRATTAIAARWDDATPEARFAVVNSVLGRQALPLALEAPKFTFAIENLTRWAFDQIARARVGTVFSSMGTRDNCHLDMAFRMHESTWRSRQKREWFVKNALATKEQYRLFVEEGRGSWQEARTVLPISVCHRFCMSINFAALQGMCARRMSFSEAEDVVAVAWLLRERLMHPMDGFPLLARWLRPGCDFSRSCNYHKAHTMSEAFSCLYKSCGRNPVRSAPGKPDLDYEYADFNEACTDRETLQEQLRISIPDAGEEMPSAEDGLEVLTPRDRYLFGFEPRDGNEVLTFCAIKNGVYERPTPAGNLVHPMKSEEALTAP